MPQFVEQARFRLDEQGTLRSIVERLHYEIALMLKDHAHASRVTAMIVHKLQGDIGWIFQYLLHLPELKKLADEAEARVHDSMDVDHQLLLEMPTAADGIAPTHDLPVISDNKANIHGVAPTEPSVATMLGKVEDFLRRSQVPDGSAAHELKAEKGTNTSSWEVRVLHVGPAGDRFTQSLSPIYVVLCLATLVLLLKL
ncbi:hypothetical protein BD410DRAFT_846894 [Rickenella mellea]|nr:hypothetical protein BD410DRAFT_846894 [Rickenella mellea]